MEWVQIGDKYFSPKNYKTLRKTGVDAYVENKADGHSKESRWVGNFFDDEKVAIKEHTSLSQAQKFVEKHLSESLKRTNKRLKELCLALEVNQ
jgi:hypothetical protein